MNYLTNLQVCPKLSPAELQELQTNFEQLCTTYDSPTHSSQDYQQTLFYAHQAPHRHYHNLSHLHNMLRLLEQFEQACVQPDLLRLAIWYHDSVYAADRKDNEALSAKLADRHWQEGLSLAQNEQLQAYILATAQHQPRTTDSDERLFLDLDLSILAAEPQVYQAYSQAIEQEYCSFYPKEVYRIGRQQVLRHFLERPQIYFSEAFALEHEVAARANLNAELRTL